MRKPTLLNKIVIGVMFMFIAGAVTITGCSSSYGTTTATQSSAPATTTPAGTNAGTITIDVTAKNVAFDKTTISVPAGAQVTINFNNQDTMPHNIAIYNDQSASQTIYKGEIFNGPAAKTYTFTAPTTPGKYFFRCDVHPGKMTGDFIVTAN